MKLNNSFLRTILPASTLFLPALGAPQGLPAALPLLVGLYPQVKYGGGTYYAASGPYSTCLSIPTNLQTVIQSVKLRPNVKQCTFYGNADCTKVKGKYETHRKDQPGVTLSPILTIKCTKG
ncbi:uncharacterized protein K444DRAFT_631449 [Hyaloscypha bicolor E]|uniref:Uncharacterized protein n=1 Tax=Hyaloscypha bicolor E TaxID=1095630 RepID=A0A2J6T4M2_9HELO|nr:uncharacterized protein K444DRAFT_631449 [Hyaloscypha bicolor E]PMD57971.1 hypothetical protein K444DRAFT_631449 [Hyaloscypha bicolor E]